MTSGRVVVLGAALFFAAAAGAAGAAPPDDALDVRARIGTTPLVVALRLPGHVADETGRAAAAAKEKAEVAFLGTIDPEGTWIGVLVRDGVTAKTAALWRDEAAKAVKGAKTAPFMNGDVPCYESVGQDKQLQATVTTRAAFVLGAGKCVEIRVATKSKGKGAFGRPEFAKVVDSLRLARLRLGPWDWHPSAFLEGMNAALRAPGNPAAVAQAKSAAAPDDWAAALVFAELVDPKTDKALVPPRLDAYKRAFAKLDAIETPTREEKFAALIAANGAARAIRESAEPAAAIDYMKSAHQLAQREFPPLRGEMAYDFARALASTGAEDRALELLDRAIEESPRWRDRARNEPDFQSVSGRPEFKHSIDPARKPKLPAGIDALKIAAAELPKDLSLVDGVHPATSEAGAFFEMPTMRGALAPPKAKSSQSIAAADGTSGTVFVFEYEDRVDETEGVFDAVAQELWGKPARPTKARPDDAIVLGRFLIVVSFPDGHPGAGFVKNRLRERTGVGFPRPWGDAKGLVEKFAALTAQARADEGIDLFRTNGAAVAERALALHYFAGFSAMKDDWEGASSQWAKAVAMDESGTDHLGADTTALASALTGLGTSLRRLGKSADAVPVLQRAVAAAEKSGDDERLAQALRALAAATAESGQVDGAVPVLKRLVEMRPETKEWIKVAAPFHEALKRDDVRALVS